MTLLAIVLVVGAFWLVTGLGLVAAFYIVGPTTLVLGVLLVAAAFAYLIAADEPAPAPIASRRGSQ